MTSAHLEPTQEAGQDLFSRAIEGEVVMLNLLRFRDIADYSADPDAAPASPISGRQAYQLYMNATLPRLQEKGGEILFVGDAGSFLIGPSEEHWDTVVLVRQHSLQEFLSFASDESYTPALAHRRAALEDSRLLPMVPVDKSEKDGRIVLRSSSENPLRVIRKDD